MKKVLAITLSIPLLTTSLSTQAATLTLYQPSFGNTPDTSTPKFLTNGGLLGGGTVTSLDNNGTNLNTLTNNSILAGFSNYNVSTPPPFPATPTTFVNSSFPTLDRTAGFSLQFRATILSETSSSSDRSGFSVTLLGSDAQGIELGFRNDAQTESSIIFAQNASFTQGESTRFNFFNQTDYELAIIGNNYTLRANNTPILTGLLRAYTTASVAANPYQTGNFIFLGDNTSQARADINLGAVSITTSTPVPFEFSPALGLGAIAIWGIFKKFQRLR